MPSIPPRSDDLHVKRKTKSTIGYKQITQIPTRQDGWILSLPAGRRFQPAPKSVHFWNIQYIDGSMKCFVVFSWWGLAPGFLLSYLFQQDGTHSIKHFARFRSYGRSRGNLLVPKDHHSVISDFSNGLEVLRDCIATHRCWSCLETLGHLIPHHRRTVPPSSSSSPLEPRLRGNF